MKLNKNGTINEDALIEIENQSIKELIFVTKTKSKINKKESKDELTTRTSKASVSSNNSRSSDTCNYKS